MNLQVVVYTPVHNREAWLQGCMESVASQDYPHKRHVIVDDCSTDNSFETRGVSRLQGSGS
jgi:teichuronic acid biosynthesis glycosyltransferase TuaG